jgi:membrane protease YdiL (CAAX protease family)
MFGPRVEGGTVADRNPFPVKPLLVFAAVVAAVRLSLSVPPGRFLSPSLLAAGLFLYAPLPRYWRRGFPAWAHATDPGRSAALFALLAGAGAIAFFLFVRLPLPPAISLYHGTAPLTAAMAAHHLLLVALPEEVFFRGYLYDAFEEAGREPVLPVSFLFAIGHFVIAPSPFRLLTFFPALLLGWGRKRSGNVYVPTAVHFLYNLFPSLIGGAP